MRGVITKRDIIEAMKDLDDDAEVRVMCVSVDLFVGQYADNIYFDDIVKGKDLQNEITIVANF